MVVEMMNRVDIGSITKNLSRGDDGIWCSQESISISYPASGNETCFAIEDDSFWFRHRNKCISSVVSRFPPRRDGVIFDIGGGNGYVAKGLIDAGFHAAVIEPGISGARNARRRGIDLVICAKASCENFSAHSFPAVGLFDVLEHLPDDAEFLRELHPLIEDDGLIYATVPAYSILWSAEDDIAGHFRRYSSSQLVAVVRRAGFDVLFSTYVFQFLPIPIFLFRTLPYRLGFRPRKADSRTISREHAVGGGMKVNLLNALLALELKKLDRGEGINGGGSCLLVARKSRIVNL
jgi:SAM-dependent methyltransferase